MMTAAASSASNDTETSTAETLICREADCNTSSDPKKDSTADTPTPLIPTIDEKKRKSSIDEQTTTPAAKELKCSKESTVSSSSSSSSTLSAPPSTPKAGGIFGMAAKNLVTFGSVQKPPIVAAPRDGEDRGRDESSKDGNALTPVPLVLEGLLKKTRTAKPTGSAGDETSARLSSLESIPPSGEEGEYTLASAKAKLFILEGEKTRDWAERGVGQLKLNVLKEDPKQSRLLMRAEGVPKVILNVRLFGEMVTEIVQTKHIRFSAMIALGESSSSAVIQHCLLRFRNPEDAIQFQVRLEHQIGRLKEEEEDIEDEHDSYPSSFDAYYQQEEQREPEASDEPEEDETDDDDDE